MYKVSYTYDNPHGAGPFKGSMIVNEKYSKGDSIYAVMGRATVVSCRAVKP
jgi:hypothetical protein